MVVACVSWGTMLSRSTTESQLQIAQILSKCGVDVIIGYGPHLIQPIGWIETQKADGSGAQRTLVLCSAGNFLSNQRSQYCDSSVVLQFTVQEQVDGSFAIESPECIPTYVLRTDEGEGNYDYHVLPVGQWKEKEFDEMPAGTNYTDYQRMLTIWQEVQEIINPETAAIVAE